MKNIDLERIGFEDLLKLQKTVNKKVIRKRKNEIPARIMIRSLDGRD